MKKTTLKERISRRIGKSLRSPSKSPVVRALGSRGAATVLIGTALSIGGLSESFSDVHFQVEKNLDTVQVFKQQGESRTIVASLSDGFAANTVFKLSSVFPDRYVTRQLALFDETAWIPEITAGVPEVVQQAGDVFHAEMSRINDAIRREFFETSLESIQREYFVKSMPYGALIHKKAEKYDVDPALVAAVIEQESRFKPRARSHVGARGLMQLMPRTGRWMGARDLYDPEQNVDAGVKYIKYLEKRFNGNRKLVIAAYNGGEGNVQRYGGVPPFRETRTYVKKVTQNYDRRKRELKKFEQSRIKQASAAEEAAGR
jgi:hypothetical protein